MEKSFWTLEIDSYDKFKYFNKTITSFYFLRTPKKNKIYTLFFLNISKLAISVNSTTIS